MTADSPQHVFLSYARADRERALAMADALERAGVSIWVDRQSIHGGASWGREIVDGIQQSAAFLLCCSPAALASRNVRQEIQLAWRYERPYVPLVLEAVEFPKEVQYFLEGWQWVDVLDAQEGAWLPVVLKALRRLGVAPNGTASGGAALAVATAPGGATEQASRSAEQAGTAAQPPGSAAPASLAAGSPASAIEPDTQDEPLRVAAAQAPAGPAVFPFVGRGPEHEALRAALASARAGSGRLVLLAGEPGIGKTRLAQELAAEAAAQGLLVLWGRCWEGEGAPPFFPWGEALRAYLRAVEAEAALSGLGADAAELAAIAPELRSLLPQLAMPAEPSEPEQSRFRLFSAAAGWLRAASSRQPVLLVLDDLHWADKPSLLLLQFLVRELGSLPLLVLGTYRDVELNRGHPLAEILAALRREPVHERLLLQGLSEGETFAFLESAGGQRLPERSQAVASALWRETEGNPFFLQETLRHLVESGALVQQDGRWVTAAGSVAELGIPEGVREVVGRRLSRLSEAANRVLGVAAVIGREFSATTLMRTGGDEDEVEAALEQAEATRLIEPVGGGFERYRFTHALIRETLYQELAGRRRVRLHRQIGQALEEQYQHNPEPHLAELAYHFLEGSPGGDVEKALAYATRAGDAALAQSAFEEAAGHYAAALGVLEQEDAPDRQRQCDLLLSLGQAQRWGGSLAEAAKTYQQAVELSRTPPDARRFALAALGWAGVVTRPWVTNPEVEALLEEARVWLGEEEAALRSRLLAAEASAVYYHGDPAHTRALAEQAVAVARGSGEPSALSFALRMLGHILRGPDAIERVLQVAGELQELAERIDDPEGRLGAHSQRAAALLFGADLAGFEAELAAMETLAARYRRHDMYQAVLSRRLARPSLCGPVAQSRAVMDEYAAFARRSRTQAALMFSDMLGAFPILQEQGWLKLFSVWDERMLGALAIPVVSIGTVLRAALEGRPAEAEALLDQFALDGFAALWQDPGDRMNGLSNLTDACAQLASGRHAEQLYEQLLPYRDLLVAYSGGFVALWPVARSLGQLCRVLRRFDQGREHFEAAIATCARLGAESALVYTRHEYALLLLDRDVPGDREQAIALLDAAAEAAAWLGMLAAEADARRVLETITG